MSQNMLRLAFLLGTVALIPSAGFASPYYQGNDCYCLQAVPQTHYQNVPVTEYRSIQQTVQRPVVETKYVERPVTEYRPVTETRVAELPTVNYAATTEWQAVQEDRSHWITQYHPNPRPTPCEYDGSPTLMGWLNRTGYALRGLVTPPVIATRQYVPQVVTRNVPVTRYVPVHGTRQVTYNVTKYVPQTTTRKVAVTTVRYETDTVTAMRPVTVMRRVPIGSSVAFAYTPLNSGTTQTVLAPSPDPISTATQPRRTQQANQQQDRVAERPEANQAPQNPRRNENGNQSPQRSTDENIRRGNGKVFDNDREPFGRSNGRSNRTSTSEPIYPSQRMADHQPSEAPARGLFRPARSPVFQSGPAPSAVRVNRWVARNRSSRTSDTTNDRRQPRRYRSVPESGVSVAENR